MPNDFFRLPKDFFRWFMYVGALGIAVVSIAAISAAAWLGLFSNPAITIRNESRIALTGVLVTGNGFSESGGRIDPGGEKTVSMHPSGDSSIRITFTAAGNHYDSGDQAYIASNGERFTATIDRDLNVRIQ